MASRQCVSESVRFRELGNAEYRRVTEGLAPSIQLSRLQQAANNYDKALMKAKDANERSSACKNLAMTYWKMAKANMVGARESGIVIRYFRDALQHFKDAKEYGKGRHSDWLSGLVLEGLRCWNDLSEFMEDWQDELRFREIVRLVGYLTDEATMAEEYLGIVNVYFNKSVMALAQRKYQQSLQLLGECRFPLNEAKRLLSWHCHNPEHTQECEILEQDIFIQTCVAESIQARVHGEELLTMVTLDEENLNLDMVWEVVDWFRRAAMLTREQDLELEAMALSALGRVYDKVLKMKDRAKTCLTRVLELANTMVPRAVWTCDWYDFARATLERYQQESLRTEETEAQKKREKVMELIKEDIKKIDEASCSTMASEEEKMKFLKFVYSTYPPKNQQHKLADVSKSPDKSEMKKLFKTAAIHYHPDRVKEEEHGENWKVLVEEISKRVNAHYEAYKGVQ